MNITTIGRGNIGGGLAKLWERNEQHESFAHEVKAYTNGPTAKAFNAGEL
jgi:predicted dinucleotide-binding enzyme